MESITYISMKGIADFFELEFYKTCQGKWLKIRKVDTILEGLRRPVKKVVSNINNKYDGKMEMYTILYSLKI